ncbi:DUF2785 domain-containing protein [Loigolactobacillus bifermentans]|jgi:hypothetical protein|uniref:DUF2785 domain-containing protein n=1 Tax=Loigolactobacillus bifermentans DSM 20003 TaxID=1423726 RepID=A0A0R1GYX8_9LACO|nr:DUF2785 domain-containing protein [Loigolactobacillus bifermentans]KRK38953.1 hypothetical protein FC07_GL002669 [Loigolactobacillus bifermentans DSM 20003]
MSPVVITTQQKLVQLREQVLSGNLYQGLPQQVGQLIEKLPTLPETEWQPLSDNQASLEAIKQLHEQVIVGHEPIEVTQIDFLLTHLKSLNPLVRDKGVYFLFNDLIQTQAFTTAQLRQIKDRLITPETLFDHILEPQNNVVFQRSFSVLLLSVILYTDRMRDHFLTKSELKEINITLATYTALESDGRGYVDQYGWAHAFTHIGNAFSELAQSKVLVRGDKIFLLVVLLERYKRLNTSLIFGEPERLAWAMINLVNQDPLYRDYLLLMLKNWQHDLAMLRPKKHYDFWVRWYNRSRLLQALYLRPDTPAALKDYLQQMLDL